MGDERRETPIGACPPSPRRWSEPASGALDEPPPRPRPLEVSPDGRNNIKRPSVDIQFGTPRSDAAEILGSSHRAGRSTQMADRAQEMEEQLEMQRSLATEAGDGAQLKRVTTHYVAAAKKFNLGSRTGRLAGSQTFERITLAIITINALWMGYDTEYNGADAISGARLQFQLAENLFTIFFTFEIGVRFFGAKTIRALPCDAWFVFDSLLVTMMIVETWVIPMVVGSGDLGAFSVLKLLRLARLSRLVKLIRQVPELLILIKGMAEATRSVSVTIFLLTIELYLFAIIFTMILRGVPAYEGMFDDISSSMYTLSLAGTMCDDITSVTIIMIDEEHYGMFTAFLLFVIVSSFTALNMLLGIVCEVIVEVKDNELEKKLIDDVKDKILDTFEALDVDGSGKISKTEFAKLTENEEVMEALAMMEVNSGHLLSLADSLFENDDNSEDVELSFTEFLKVLVHLRPGTNASVMDVAETRKTMRRVLKKTEAKLEEVDNAIGLAPAMSDHLLELKGRIKKFPAVIRLARNRTLAAEAQAQVLREKLASHGR
jgi:hypothetical protein